MLNNDTIMQSNPFPGAIIRDWSFLDELTSRQPCPSCKKSRKYYCYSCNVALPNIKEKLPRVKLPIKVDIIKHPSEMDGKSTSTHAAILAPEEVTIHTYPYIPDYKCEKVVIVFPGKDSITLNDFLEENANSKKVQEEQSINDSAVRLTTFSKDSNQLLQAHTNNGTAAAIKPENFHETVSQDSSCCEGDSCVSRKRMHTNTTESTSSCQSEERPEKMLKLSEKKLPFDRVIFIDSTWNQTSNIINDERLKDFQRVELKLRHSNFWRKQQGIPTTYLSTIEAIYYFIKDLHTTFINASYDNEYDNLLFLFCFMYNKISNSSEAKEKNLKNTKS